MLWSYGRRGNDDFFAYHGFVLGSNPDEDVVLFESTAGLVDWALQQLPGLQEGLASGSGGREEQQLLALAGEKGWCFAVAALHVVVVAGVLNLHARLSALCFVLATLWCAAI